MNPYEMNKMKILALEPQTSIDTKFIVEFNKPLICGQFLQLSVPGVGEAPISVSDFDGKKLEMTIRKVGRLTDALFDLQVGDSFYYRGPYGNGFDIEEFKGTDLIIITGGTGLAPVKQLAKHFINNPSDTSSFKMISGFKSPEDVLFADEFKEWKKSADITLTIDNEHENWSGDVGLVTQFVGELGLDKKRNKKIIVVGPPPMMKFMILELLKNGCKDEEICVSFERNMSCGLGKCGHCKIDETYVCLEGPVFSYTKARNLID